MLAFITYDRFEKVLLQKNNLTYSIFGDVEIVKI